MDLRIIFKVDTSILNIRKHFGTVTDDAIITQVSYVIVPMIIIICENLSYRKKYTQTNTKKITIIIKYLILKPIEFLFPLGSK